jgi:uncharacterized zinc-type alcohol dehydrogenase-like protein
VEYLFQLSILIYIYLKDTIMEGEIPIGENEYKEVAWAVTAKGSGHKPIWIPRGNVGDEHVKFELIYCGICHSDVHVGNNDMGSTVFPFVGGHELLGKVTEVGKSVTKFKIGDIVGVGCMVDSCLNCSQCDNGDEPYCMGGMTGTWNADRKHGRVPGNKDLKTFGGYTGSSVVHEHFVCKIPEGIPLEAAGPIMCAGITMYDPLRHWGATGEKKMTVGIIGIGGLGTMGIKIAKACGNDVMAISTSANKEAIAKEKGATHFCVSKDPESMKANAGKCDIILNTVSASHDLNAYIPLLAKSGTLVQLGLVTEPHQVSQLPFMFNRLSIAGSLIGGMQSTNEVLELCAKHKIFPDCQVIEADKIDWAWDQLTGEGGNKDGVRYVIDIKKSLASEFVPK